LRRQKWDNTVRKEVFEQNKGTLKYHMTFFLAILYPLAPYMAVFWRF